MSFNNQPFTNSVGGQFAGNFPAWAYTNQPFTFRSNPQIMSFGYPPYLNQMLIPQQTSFFMPNFVYMPPFQNPYLHYSAQTSFQREIQTSPILNSNNPSAQNIIPSRVIEISDDEGAQKQKKQTKLKTLHIPLQIKVQKKQVFPEKIVESNIIKSNSEKSDLTDDKLKRNSRQTRNTRSIHKKFKHKIIQKEKEMKKKRLKRKLIYKLSSKERMLSKISRLRELTAEIMVGPYFQSKLPELIQFNETGNEWKLKLKEKLLIRKLN